MKATEALKEVMKANDIGPSKMGARLGKSAPAICARLSQENISVSLLNEMLRVMDYKVVIVPRSHRVTEGSYEVE